MSTTQNYDFGAPNDDLNKQQADSAEPGDAGAKPEGVLGAVGNISQVASNAVIIIMIDIFYLLSK